MGCPEGFLELLTGSPDGTERVDGFKHVEAVCLTPKAEAKLTSQRLVACSESGSLHGSSNISPRF